MTIKGGRQNDLDERRLSTASRMIFGREELDRNGDSNIGDVLKRLPGVTIGGRPGRGGDIRMRGTGSGYTQILINGERAPRGFSMDSLSPDQVERIEVASNPVQDVRAPKAGKPLPKALSVDDSVQLASFEGKDQDPWLEARDAALVELLYGGGLRVSELTGLDVHASASARGWVDGQAGEAHVLGKGGKRRTVPVGAKACEALQRWLAVRDPARAFDAQAALFIGRNGTRLSAQSIWLRLKQRSQQAGLATPVHPHMLRHSFASHLIAVQW